MDRTDKKSIFIIGQRRIEHELMSSFLSKEIGADCHIHPTCYHAVSNNSFDSVGIGLLLWDCQGRDLEKYLQDLDADLEHCSPGCIVAMLNLPMNTGVEEDAVSRGVRGFFYESDSLGNLAKGIAKLFCGELWVSRDITTRIILKKGISRPNRPRKEVSDLTHREIEILKLVAVGTTNEEIAEDLNISPHTVRTHLHNIFKKINVPNRLQAALWVADNLSGS